MGEIKPLMNKAAIKKIKDMIGGGGDMVMFCCNLGSAPLDVTPMAIQQIDDDGTVWFFSVKGSDRNAYVKKDSRVQLLYGSDSSSDYLSIYGEGEVMKDDAKAKELWSPFAKTWFQEGPTDPSLTIIRFKPSEGFYWDTKNGKMVATAKMLASLVTGTTMDDSVEGELKV